MIKIIVSGHGELSNGILNAFEMIFGPDTSIKAVPFYKGEGLPQMQEKFSKELVQLKQQEELLFLVDIFGGTPYNAAAQEIKQRKDVDILSGVSLPLLLEAASIKDKLDLANLVKHLKQTAIENIKIFSEEIEKVKISDEEEEIL